LLKSLTIESGVFMKRFPAAAVQNNAGRSKITLIQEKKPHFLARLLSGWLRRWRNRSTWLPPSASPQDPFAWSPAPIQPKPKLSGGAVAVAEPDDE
jgi:hypothetical protein